MISSGLTRLTRRGAAGETVPLDGLARSVRHSGAGPVLVIYGVSVIVTLLVSTVITNATVTLVVDVLLFTAWALIAVFLVAVGTPLSRGLAAWGVLLVAALIAAVKSVSALIVVFTFNATSQLYEVFGLDESLPGRGGYIFRVVLFGALTIVSIIALIAVVQASAQVPPSALRSVPVPPVAPGSFPHSTHPVVTWTAPPPPPPSSGVSPTPPPPPPP